MHANDAFTVIVLWIAHAQFDGDGGKGARARVQRIVPRDAHEDGIALGVEMTIEDASGVVSQRESPHKVNEGEFVERGIGGSVA